MEANADSCVHCRRPFKCSDIAIDPCTPLMLQCAHSVCRACVTLLSTTKQCQITCTECQKKTVVPAEGLPLNCFLLGYLLLKEAGFICLVEATSGDTTGAVSGHRSAPELCEECARDIATLTCDKCQDSKFCQSCFNKVHGNSNLLSRHVSTAINITAARCKVKHGGMCEQLECKFSRLHGVLQWRQLQLAQQLKSAPHSQISAALDTLDRELECGPIENMKPNVSVPPPCHVAAPSVASASANGTTSAVTCVGEQPSSLHQVLHQSSLLNAELLDQPRPAPVALLPTPGDVVESRIAANLTRLPPPTVCNTQPLAVANIPVSPSANNNPEYPQNKLVMKEVVVTHLSTPSYFFVRRHCFEQLLADTQRRVQLAATTSLPLNTIPARGILCLACYSGDKSWYRAKILSVDVSNGARHGGLSRRHSGRTSHMKQCIAQVLYIDFGNHERVPLSRLRAMPSALADCPSALALPCCLAGVQPAGVPGSPWPKCTVDEFAKLVRGVVLVLNSVEVCDDGTHLVELFSRANPGIRQDQQVSVQQHLIMFKHARAASAGQVCAPSVARLSLSDAGSMAVPAVPASLPSLLQSPLQCPGAAVTSTSTDHCTPADSTSGRQQPAARLTASSASSSNTGPGPGCSPPSGALQRPQHSADRRIFYPAEVLRRGGQTEVMISHVESPSRFCVQQLGVYATCMNLMMNEIQQVYSASRNFSNALLNPRVGQVCVARYSVDNRFYRAIIEQVFSRAQVHVLYVDFGNRERLPLDRVRKLEDRFLKVAEQAIWCSLADIVPINSKRGWTDEASRFFSAFVDKPLKMYVDSVSGRTHTVTLYMGEGAASVCVNALLVKNRMATGVGPSTRLAELTKNCVDSTELVPSPLTNNIRSTSRTSSGASGPPTIRGAHDSSATATTAPLEHAFDCGSSHGDLPPHGETGVSVTVSHFVSPGDFWVHKTNESNERKSLLHDLQVAYGSRRETGETDWAAGDMAVTCCPPSNCFHRVKLTRLSDSNTVQAVMVDCGVTVSLPKASLQHVLPQFASLAPLALHCSLDNVRPTGDDTSKWTGSACDFMHRMIQSCRKLFLIHKSFDNGLVTCDLEVEEEIVAGALEPARVIRTSLTMKLVDEGLAFRGRVRAMLDVGSWQECQPLTEDSHHDTLFMRRNPPQRASSNHETPQSSADSVSSETGIVAAAVDSAVDSVPVLSRQSSSADISGCCDSPARCHGDGDNLDLQLTATPESTVSCDSATGHKSPDQFGAESDCLSDDSASVRDNIVEEEGALDSGEDIPLGSDWKTFSKPSILAPASEAERLDSQVQQDEEAAERVVASTGHSAESIGWLPAPLPQPGSTFEAVATHVSMECTIYLHTKHAGGEALKAISSMLHAQFLDSEPRPCDEMWSVGEPCFAKFYLDGGWYRAQVVKKHVDGKLSVLFVDHGNTDKVNATDLRRNIFTNDIPVQALACQLYNIVPLSESGQFSVKTLDFIHQQLVEKDCRVTVHHVIAHKRRLLVSLQLLCSGLDIGHMLVQMGSACRMTPEELAESLLDDDELSEGGGGAAALVDALKCSSYGQLKLPFSSCRRPVPVLVAAVLSPELVILQPQCCQQLDDQADDERRHQLDMHVRQLSELSEPLAALAEHQPLLQPPLSRGCACLARSPADELWYRATVVGRSDDPDACLVFLVDVGVLETMPYNSVRQLPECMQSVPAWTLLARVHGVCPQDRQRGWSERALDMMKTCLFCEQQLYARLKCEAIPPQVELVTAPGSSAPVQLAYQSLIDQAVLTLKPDGASK